MKRSDFNYSLPEELIAQYPLANRADSRLLLMSSVTGLLQDEKFMHLPDLLKAGDLLIFNDTRVIPARLYGVKSTGGKVEILVERIIADEQVLAQVRASKSPKPGSIINLDSGDKLNVDGRDGDFFILSHPGSNTITGLIEKYGHTPLPPYINREDELSDQERYQTIYSKQPGAVAAPTAGLHFSVKLFEEFKESHVETAFITLHVGAGTFQPIRTERIEDHVMHKEWFSISDTLCEQIKRVKRSGGRIIAVGTTVVRTLESACKQGVLEPKEGETEIFIYPGYEFQVIDGLITNFHLPESTLIMLVCAFAGKGNTFKAYEHAISAKYRFFSYGDAMLIL